MNSVEGVYTISAVGQVTKDRVGTKKIQLL